MSTELQHKYKDMFYSFMYRMCQLFKDHCLTFVDLTGDGSSRLKVGKGKADKKGGKEAEKVKAAKEVNYSRIWSCVKISHTLYLFNQCIFIN